MGDVDCIMLGKESKHIKTTYCVILFMWHSENVNCRDGVSVVAWRWNLL